MANPQIPGLSGTEQARLYEKLKQYNQGRASYKEAGAYLVVLPRAGRQAYTLWVYSPLPERQAIFFLCDLSPDVQEALRTASTLCFYSVRRLLLVEYNAKRMQGKGDGLVPFGKYRGHYLHEVLHIDPAYLAWIAFKFQPRIPKQERFVQIAKIYHSVYLDVQRRKLWQKKPPAGRFLAAEGERVAGLRLTVLAVRVEDNPYKTKVRDGVPFFYVRQVLVLCDAAGNRVVVHVNARTASRHSGQLPALERAYQAGEEVTVESARVIRTYTSGNVCYTRLAYVRFGQA